MRTIENMGKFEGTEKDLGGNMQFSILSGDKSKQMRLI
jgi:hypothetical protein